MYTSPFFSHSYQLALSLAMAVSEWSLWTGWVRFFLHIICVEKTNIYRYIAYLYTYIYTYKVIIKFNIWNDCFIPLSRSIYIYIWTLSFGKQHIFLDGETCLYIHWTCIYIYICMNIKHIYVYRCIYVCVYLYIYMRNKSKNMCVCIYIYIDVETCIYKYVSTSIYLYMLIYIYIDIHRFQMMVEFIWMSLYIYTTGTYICCYISMRVYIQLYIHIYIYIYKYICYKNIFICIYI